MKKIALTLSMLIVSASTSILSMKTFKPLVTSHFYEIQLLNTIKTIDEAITEKSKLIKQASETEIYNIANLRTTKDKISVEITMSDGQTVDYFTLQTGSKSEMLTREDLEDTKSGKALLRKIRVLEIVNN